MIMSNDVFATDHPLTAAQQRTLSAILDTILPASEDGQMPSARELDFIGHLREKGEDFMPLLADVVGEFNEDFSDLPLAERCPLVEDFSKREGALFEQLLLHVYSCYYQDDRALEGLGLAAGPPFPRGNSVEPGDLALLDPVLRQSRTYRK